MVARIFSGGDRKFASALSEWLYVNPFLPERSRLERKLLGADFREEPDAFALGPGHVNSNLVPIKERTGQLLAKARPQLESRQFSDEDLELYRNLVRFWLYFEFLRTWRSLHRATLEPGFTRKKVRDYEGFVRELHRLVPASLRKSLTHSSEHLFACLFQIYRAFHNVFKTIIGANLPAQDLRAKIWCSVLTANVRRYERSLYKSSHLINTLILGPSGTGKELVARAIGLSRYLPFNGQTARFQEEVLGTFLPLNISALSPTLVESELFGHVRGSFTGATAERVGWLESCPPHGTVFLDEIGELDAAIQVKLLRTLQSREFQRVGEQALRHFRGKLVCATNRDLEAGIADGSFREDFYYRLCSDVVKTPGLRVQLRDRPEDLKLLLENVVTQHFEAEEVSEIVGQVHAFIDSELGLDYAWPGNVRELTQCVFSVVVRGSYEPRRVPLQVTDSEIDVWSRRFANCELDAERLLDVYCTLAYARTGSFSECGRRLGIDRRTVKGRVDGQLLQRLRKALPEPGAPDSASSGRDASQPGA